MRADPRFTSQPRHFWANVRSISQEIGYTARKTGQIRVYSLAEMQASMARLGLESRHLVDDAGPTALGTDLQDYFAYRAEVLNQYVEPRLMNAEAAKALYNEMLGCLKPTCPLPLNKQKNEKAGPAYLTCMVNMLVEAYSHGIPVTYDPLELTTVTRNGAPLRTLARRVDGAFPAAVNPIGIWEVKEYYYTTTFGSRVADGVYETLLDGLELEELREHEHVEVEHLLIVDAHYTWWACGRSYLCRIVDMLNMGAVDEVLFGREVPERLPAIVEAWVRRYRTEREVEAVSLVRPGKAERV